MDTDLQLDREALALFRRLLDLQTHDRAGFEAELSSLAPELSSRVRRLLDRHHHQTGQAEQRWQQALTPGLPAQLGPFTLLREIGRGGMGIVAEAQREAEGFTQRVAIKWIPAWQVDATRRQRFLFEREVVTRLRHPHIAQLVDGGEGEHGELWYAMELVEGKDLLRHCIEHRLGLHARVRLLLDLCEAVAYAHRNLILHRDIKPSNVLVDREGRLKLIDFGIAKGLDEAAEGPTLDAAPMTPRYAAPEQLRGERPTTAADLWQVAALAFELLSGQPARKDGQVRWASLATVEAKGEHAEHCGLDPLRLQRALRGDLDAILQAGLREAPGQRYPSVEALAADFRAWLQGQTVSVRRHERWYAVSRFVRRHAGALALGSAALLVVVVSAYVTFQQGQRALEQSRIAEGSTDLLLQIMLSTPGSNLTNLTLRGYFDHVIEKTLQDTALPLAQRYRVLAGVVDRSLDLDASAAAERGAWALIGLTEQVHGKDSLQAAVASDQWVALALQRQPKRAAELEPHLARTAATFARLGVRSGPEYIEHIEARIRLLADLGDATAAVALADQMYSLAEAAADLEIDARLSYMSYVDKVYLALGEGLKASNAADRTLRFAEEASLNSEDAGSTLDHLRSVSCLARSLHDPASAVTLCREFEKSMRTADTLMTQSGSALLSALGVALTKLGENEDALLYLQQADQALVQIHGADAMPMQRAEVLDTTGVVLSRLDRHAEALRIRERLLAWLRSRYSENHRNVLVTRIELAESMIAMERKDEAGALLDPQADLSELPESWRERWHAALAELEN